MSTVYIKQHSREYSLFRIALRDDIICKDIIPKELGITIDIPCTVYCGSGVRATYYTKTAWSSLFRAIGSFAQETSFVERHIYETLSRFDFLLPYFRGDNIIKTREELHEFLLIYTTYYFHATVLFAIPQIPDVPEECLQLALSAREKIQEYNESAEDVFRSALSILYPAYQEYTDFIFPEEVWKDVLPSFSTIAERQKGYIYFNHTLYTNISVEQFEQEYNIHFVDTEEIVGQLKEIRGKVAYGGVVSGIVKCINSASEIDKVQEGDILVAAMTMPRYISAMKRAAAFVTDEGGITCHAAIIAREMKKPCIIGTKIATKVLKDGDRVEADAVRGIIKVL